MATMLLVETLGASVHVAQSNVSPTRATYANLRMKCNEVRQRMGLCFENVTKMGLLVRGYWNSE